MIELAQAQPTLLGLMLLVAAVLTVSYGLVIVVWFVGWLRAHGYVKTAALVEESEPAVQLVVEVLRDLHLGEISHPAYVKLFERAVEAGLQNHPVILAALKPPKES